MTLKNNCWRSKTPSASEGVPKKTKKDFLKAISELGKGNESYEQVSNESWTDSGSLQPRDDAGWQADEQVRLFQEQEHSFSFETIISESM